MFDNTNPQPNQPQTPPNQPNPPAVPPQPAREPEDIFAGTERSAAQKPRQFQPKEPVTGMTGGGQPPVDLSASPASPASSSGGSAVQQSGSGQNRKYLIIGIIAIGGLLVILIAMIALAYFKAQEAGDVTANIPVTTTTTPSTTPLDTSNDVSSLDTTATPATTGNATTSEDSLDSEEQGSTGGEKNAQFILDEITDSDSDGLTDGEEKRLGTDLNSSDTDRDGLFDRQEVRIYRTDPTVADTDGDGYTDGEEVDNGYNPKGDGKLYELP